MAFLVAGSLDNKQHLNLSVSAMQIIENDMLIFNSAKNLSGFLNQVFSNYIDDAESSISLSLEKEKRHLEEVMKALPQDLRYVSIDTLIKDYKGCLLKKVKNYPKGEGIKFRINQRNFNYLTQEDSECHEDLYYTRIGQYFKAVIEEYASKTFLDRERIYLKDTFTLITEAIERHRQLKVRVSSGRAFYVYPYKITSGQGASHHYLIGRTLPVKGETVEQNTTNSSLRISNLYDIKILESKSGRLTNGQKEELDSEIITKGPQFMANETSDIHVYLSPVGKQKYKNQLHLRPQHFNIIDDSIYVFQCTELQIEYYFFKFGKDAKVLKPQHLAERLSKQYKEAYNFYASGDTEILP
jgi:hypothetical protein